MTRRLAATPYRRTEVSASRSQVEIDRLLRNYGIEDTQVTKRGRSTTLRFASADDAGHMDAYEMRAEPLADDDQGERQSMRMLWHWLKTKLEIIEYGLADLATEFMPYRLVSTEHGPQTLARTILPQLTAGGSGPDPFRPALPAPGASK